MASKNVGPTSSSRTTWRPSSETGIHRPQNYPESSSIGGQIRHVNVNHHQQQQKANHPQLRYSHQNNDLQVMSPPTGPSLVQHQQQAHHTKNIQHQQSQFGGQQHGSGPGSGGGGGQTTTLVGPFPGGELFLENLDSCSRNPLFCLICNNVFDDPRLLSCYHSFCAKCLDGRLGDIKLACPLCGKVTSLKEDTGPPTDHLLRFLLRASSDVQPPCANCDNKNRVPMYYCNTCGKIDDNDWDPPINIESKELKLDKRAKNNKNKIKNTSFISDKNGQVLCNGCREETHRAKMFSAHDIIPVSKFSKETPKKCSVHGEQYIMFSTVQKSMLCMLCYRDTAMDARLHCVDLETAYSQGCRKLDRAVMSLRDLQVAVRDGITMLKNVLEELRRNSDSEKSAVNAVCQTILDALTKTQENLLRDVDCQLEVKDKVIRGQLSQLRSVLPTIKLHLTMCATISNAASKYDFLDLAYPLIDRLTAITHMGYPIRPGQSSQIKSSYKSEIVRTLEPWISGTHPPVTAMTGSGGGPSVSATNVPFLSSTSQLPKDYAHPSTNLTSVDPAFSEPTYSQYYPMSRSTMTPTTGHKPPLGPLGVTGGGGGGYAAPSGIGNAPVSASASSGRKTPTSKGKSADGMDEQFTAHCRSFTSHVTELSQRLARLKEQVQDLHRDVTLQRGTSYAARAEAALREGLYLEEQLNRRQSEMERIKKLFESTWNEHIRQVRIEQEVFQTQMNDLMSLRAEVKQLSSILQQLQSFLKSMGAQQQQQQQQQGGGGGGSGSGGGGGSGSGGGGSSGAGGGGPSGGGSSTGGSRQPQYHQQQQQQQQTIFQDNKTYHLSSVGSEALSRAESGSQVTPSLGEMAFSKGGIGGSTPGIGLKGGKKDSGQSLKPSGSELTSRLGRFSISKVTSANVPPGMSSFLPLTTSSGSGGQGQTQQLIPGKMGMGGSNEMEYIQVDTSYPTHALHSMSSAHSLPPAPPPPSGAHHLKRGMLSQLIDKVRSTKEDRKKSSSSSSGGISGIGFPLHHSHSHQHTPGVAALNQTSMNAAAVAASRVRAAMYDAQVQYGTLANFQDKSAVTALRRSGSQRQQRVEERPVYTRAKSFVKSKSDDERPPAKLSRECRARSVAALETESLLRSLSSGSKEASRILSLYKSLLSDKESPSYYRPYIPPPSSTKGEASGKSIISSTASCSSSAGRSDSNRYRKLSGLERKGRESEHSAATLAQDRNYLSEDDYQQIPMLRVDKHHQNITQHHQQQQQQKLHAEATTFRKASLPAPSHSPGQMKTSSQQQQSSSQPRYHHPGSLGRDSGRSGQSHTQVKVFVHEEPQSSRSSPAQFSRSLEESYLYSFLSQQGNGSTNNNNRLGLLKKPVSCESLISLSSTTGTGNSRKSSIDFDRRSVVTVRRAGSKNGLLPRQHSWEVPTSSLGIPPYKVQSSSSTPALSPEMFGGVDDDEFARSSSSSGRRNPFEDNELGRLHKADSFEGHEEAVRSIVAAVQETRTLQRKMQSN